METSGILLLADISGYTKFLTRTAIEHATWIVTNLFSSMLDVKPKELEVLEIEGDAIFCWLPSDFRRKDWTVVNDLISRQHRRFVATQNWFLNVDKCETSCGCPACTGVRSLKIKFILHSGRVGFYRIANFKQIAGLDVIIAHRLLKNSVPTDEYQLISADLLTHLGLAENAPGWIKNHDTYPVIGTVPYYYRELVRDDALEILEPPYKEPIG